jgi:LysR family transcriptional regulator, transcriptional activator of the cysJI operon
MPFTNVHYLRIFLSVLKQRSFSGAADVLHISQPSVSIQIRRLEKSLGVKLFERFGRAVYPTSEAGLVAEYANQISDLLSDLETEVFKFDGLNKGRLVVGGNTSPGIRILPLGIAELKKDYPDAYIELRINDSDQLERWLLENDIDLAVILGNPKSAQLRKEYLYHEDRVLVLPPKHPLMKKAHISLTDLANQQILVTESGRLKLLVEKIFSDKRVSVQQTRFGNYEAIVTAISRGLGISILSKSMVERHAETKTIATRRIEGINLKAPVYVVLHKKKHLSRLGDAFLARLRLLAN